MHTPERSVSASKDSTGHGRVIGVAYSMWFIHPAVPSSLRKLVRVIGTSDDDYTQGLGLCCCICQQLSRSPLVIILSAAL